MRQVGHSVDTKEVRHGDFCKSYDSLGHRLQACQKSSTWWCTLHNKVMEKLKSQLERVGWLVWLEPAIKTHAGLRKPDVIATGVGHSCVVDVTIISDNTRLDREHELNNEKSA